MSLLLHRGCRHVPRGSVVVCDCAEVAHGVRVVDVALCTHRSASYPSVGRREGLCGAGSARR